jgi:hypothetical protein
MYKRTLIHLTHFGPEDGGSIYLRNVDNTVHIYTVQNPRSKINIMWRIARQRLAKHVPERYGLNKNRRPLPENGFSYHGITSLSDATTLLEPLRAVISTTYMVLPKLRKEARLDHRSSEPMRQSQKKRIRLPQELTN